MPQTAQGTTRPSPYAQSIRADLAALGFIGRYEASHVEAWMRLEHSTLDGLSTAQFRDEVRAACQCIDAAGAEESAALAASFGL